MKLSIKEGFRTVGIIVGIQVGILLLFDLICNFFQIAKGVSIFLSYTLANVLVILILRKKIRFSSAIAIPEKLDIITLASLLAIQLNVIFILDPITEIIPSYSTSKPVFTIYLSIALYCIAAPITEEIIFRGYLFKHFLSNLSPIQAILLTSLFFGIVHLNPVSVVHASLTGLVYTWVFYKTGSLLFSIFLHMINNVSAVVYENSSISDVKSFYYLFANKMYYFSIYTLCVLALIILLLYVNRHFHSVEGYSYKSNDKL